jgi:ATP-dependent helicase/nuclease subunit A
MNRHSSPDHAVIDLPFLSIRAAAGTGKTYSLTRRYLILVDRGVDPQQILATTFTRKAAAEIMSRILGRLARAVLYEDDLKELASFLDRAQVTQADAERLLDLFVDRWPQLRIGTLDRFFADLVRAKTWDLGLPAGWTIADPNQDAPVRADALARLYESLGHQALTQLAALLFKGESARKIHEEIDAITSALHELWLQIPADAWQSVPLAAELEPTRLEALLKEVEQLTFKDSRQIKARDHEVSLARQADWKTLAQNGLLSAITDGKDKYYTPIPKEALRVYEPLADELRAQRRNPLAHQNQATERLLATFDQHYRQRQMEVGTLRFADVTRMLLSLGESALSGSPLSEVRHLLLDEFQDTSVAQWKVLLPLVRQCARSASGSIFIVGDPKQAIYGWRGGAAELLDTVGNSIEGLVQEELIESRRSSPIILDAVNQVFGNLATNDVLQGKPYLAEAARRWNLRFAPHRSAYPDRPGYVAVHVAEPVPPDDDSSPMASAALKVARWHHESPSATIGVLVRKNESVAQMLSLLRELHIDASQEGGSPVATNPAVGLILSWLTWLDHPNDSVSFFHVSTSIWATALGLTGDEQDAVSIAEQHRRQLLAEGYAITISSWIDTLAPLIEDRSVGRLDQLLELAHRFDETTTLRPSDFVRFVEETRLDDPRPAAVRVMNIHQSKGLEFDLVVLPELGAPLRGMVPKLVVGFDDILQPARVACRYVSEKDQALLPDRVQRAFREELTRDSVEELCLLYVAMTRARYECHAVLAPSKGNEKKPSATLAGVLRGGLGLIQPLLPATTPYQLGDANAHLSLRSVDDPSAKQTITLNPTGPGKESSPLEQSLVVRSPSRAGRATPQQSLTLRPTDSTRRGSLIHAWLSLWSWNDESPPLDAELLALARQRFPSVREPVAILTELKAWLDQPSIRSGFERPAGEIELWRERSFAIIVEKSLLSGTLDRVVLFKEGGQIVRAELIDFKTDQIHDARGVQVRADHYREQMLLYRKALSKMLRLAESDIHGAIWFLAIDERFSIEIA